MIPVACPTRGDVPRGDVVTLPSIQRSLTAVSMACRSATKQFGWVRLFSDVAETKEIDHLTLLRRDFGMGSGSGTLASS